MHVHAWCDMTWQSLVTFCWCNNAAATSGNMPPYAAAAISLPAVRCRGGWRFLRLGCGCGQEAATLAKLDSTDKSPGCRAPYGLQLRVEQATRHELGHILLQSLQATNLIAKQREAGEVKRHFGKFLGNMHRIYGWEYVKNTIWHYNILLTGITIWILNIGT